MNAWINKCVNEYRNVDKRKCMNKQIHEHKNMELNKYINKWRNTETYFYILHTYLFIIFLQNNLLINKSLINRGNLFISCVTFRFL